MLLMCVQCQISLSLFCLFVCFLVVVDFEEKILHEKKEAKKCLRSRHFYWCRCCSITLHIIIIMSNNNTNNAMKRVERLKTHFVVSAPLLNNESSNTNNSFVERQETSFFSSPFGVRSFVYCFFLHLWCVVCFCAFLSSSSKSSLCRLSQQIISSF